MRKPLVQAKWIVGQPGDQYEQEADRVADVVTHEAAPKTGPTPQKPSLTIRRISPVDKKPLHRQPTEEEEEKKEKKDEEDKDKEEHLQSKESSGKPPNVPPKLTDRIKSLLGRGRPLPQSEREYFEPRFGHDFSKIRIHHDAEAAGLARAINAQSFTHGNDIFFDTGQYQPNAPQGRWLLAHELTHVVQQQPEPAPVARTSFARNDRLSWPDEPSEVEAEQAASKIMNGRHMAGEFFNRPTFSAPEVISRRVANQPFPEVHEQLQSGSQAVAQLATWVIENIDRDPEDRLGGIRKRLAALDISTRAMVLERVQMQILPKQWENLQRLLSTPVSELDQSGEAETSPETPAPAKPRKTASESTKWRSRLVPFEFRLFTRDETESPQAEHKNGRAAHFVLGLPITIGALVETPPVEQAEKISEEQLAEKAPAALGILSEEEPTAKTGKEKAPAEKETPIERLAEPAPVEAGAPPAAEEAPAPEPAEKAAAGGVLAAGLGEAAAAEEAVSPAEQEEEAAKTEERMAQAQRGEELETEEESVESEAAPEIAETAPAEETAVEPEAPEPVAESEAAPEVEPQESLPAEPLPSAEAEPEIATPPALKMPENASSEAEPPAVAEPERAEEPAASMEAEPAAESPEAAGLAAEESEETSAPASGGPVLESGEQQAALSAVAENVGDGGTAKVGLTESGKAIVESTQAAAPDLAQADDPAQVLAAVGNLPLAQLQAVLPGVSGAATRSVGAQREELAANPPQMQRPSGAPTTAETPIAERIPPPAAGGPRTIARAPAGRAVPTPRPAPLPKPPAPPTQAVKAPPVHDDSQGKITADDAQRMRTSLRNLPTTDPGLGVDAGPAPTLALEGDADPARAREQQTQLERGIAAAHAQGQRDAAQSLGENEIYPKVPEEALRAQVPAAKGGANGAAKAAGGATSPAGPAGAPAVADEAASIIAQEQRGEEVRTAVGQAQGEIGKQRAEHANKVAEERARSNEEIARLQQANAAEQQRERTTAQQEVQRQRGEWTAAQKELVDRKRAETDQVSRTGEQDIAREQDGANKEAATQISEGNLRAEEARKQGEEEAESKRREAEQESSGVFGWIASQATAFFNQIKEGIKFVFEKARAAVRAAINAAKQLAVAVLEKARQAVVAVIRRVGDALIAIGNVVLADFPALRDRFRNAIKERVAQAEKVVNFLAEKLKAGVQKALDLLGAALDAALGLLEKAYLLAIDAVNRAVQGAITYAKTVVQAFAAFAVLIKDIAADPIQWIKNLGAAVVDGIRNHLWKAFKEAIQNWFNQKIEEVLGLGTVIWNLLRQGGIKIAAIGRMAWEGIKQAIPVALIQILVEKLVAMIVPAVGAIMAIIEGLRAAWGTVSRIIAAFEKFFAFLKAVKFGNAGQKFAQALAAAAIAVIDFVANWLLRRLRKPAGKIAGKVRAIAQRILQKIKSVAKKVGAKLKKIGRKLKAKFKKVTRKFKKGKGKKKPKKNKAQKAQERLDKAVRELRPKIDRLMQHGVSGLRLRAQLLFWRIKYRLNHLSFKKEGTDTVQIEARVNPRGKVTSGYMPRGKELRQLIYEVAEQILKLPKVQEAAQRIREQRAERRDQPVEIAGPSGFPGAVSYFRKRGGRIPKWGRVQPYEIGSQPIQVSEQQRTGAFNAIVMQVGTYPEITQDLTRIMKQTGMSDLELAQGVKALVRTGELPLKLQQESKTLGGLTMLLFGREAVRNPAMVVAAPMTLSLIAEGKMTWKDALSGSRSDFGGGAFPMSMEGAQAAARGLEAQTQGLAPSSVDGGTAKNRHELAKREADIARRWLEMEMKKEGLDAFKNRSQAVSFIRKRILKFYGLS